jgi:GNAT superfamily N-acetyltransferase
MFSACHLPGVIEQYFRAIPQEQDDVAMDFRELTDSSDDLALLRRFYDSLYVTEFPDADERESYANMARYLRLKRYGWYKRNNYHIVVAMRGVEPIGGAIVDFLEQPAAGVIEFLFVARKERQTGIGRALLEHTERLLEEDARERVNRGLTCIVGEMNDPFLPARVGDNIDPWARTLIWEKWGYRGFDFRYLQPALSGAQLPVTNLMLIGKILRSDWREAVPAQDLKLIVREYFRWAMRIEEPEKTCIEYREMAAYLDVRGEVPTLSLGAYVGNDTARPIYRTEVRGEFHPDFGPAMSLYRGTFGTGALTVDEADFRRAIASSGGDARYHLWALRHLEGGAVEGLASFFALPTAGFGGYIALSGKLQGAGCLPLVVARIEEQMLRDRPAARGWYIEVGPATDPAPFLRLGFREIAVDYAQPALGPGRDSVKVRLLFKPFGRCYGLTPLPSADLLTALEEILRVVYGIIDARAHASYLSVARAIDPLAGSVPFR